MPMAPNPHTLMQLALAQARLAGAAGEVPVGAVVAGPDGTILASAHNQTFAGQNPTLHAEMLACAAAAKVLGTPYLTGCTVAVTLEPCAMCAQALAYYRVGTIIYGADDPKSGGTAHGARVLAHSHHQPSVLAGIEEAACAELLTSFFAARR
jgi:tRNA(adenine34) deaminase